MFYPVCFDCSSSEIIKQFISFFLVGFLTSLILIYLVWSLIQKKKTTTYQIKNSRINKTISFLIAFILLETLFYIIGSFFTWYAFCTPCIKDSICPPCPSGNYSVAFSVIGIIPNLLISWGISVLIKRYKK